MDSPLRLYRPLAVAFGEAVRAVHDDQWGDPTPCTEWDGRHLVNHLASETLSVTPLMGGATVEEVGDRFDGDVLGADPKATWASAADDAIAAVEAVSPDRLVHLTGRDVTATDYAGELVLDLFVHRWDLAKATGADATLDPDLAAEFGRAIVPFESVLRATGLFGVKVDVPEDADPSTKLLGMLGRRADWAP